MDGLPPPAPAVASVSVCKPALTQARADRALASLSQTMPKTKFLRAWPACFPGLIAVQLGDGSVAYTDTTARYLIIGLVLDTSSGKALDHQLEGLADKNPSE